MKKYLLLLLSVSIMLFAACSKDGNGGGLDNDSDYYAFKEDFQHINADCDITALEEVYSDLYKNLRYRCSDMTEESEKDLWARAKSAFTRVEPDLKLADGCYVEISMNRYQKVNGEFVIGERIGTWSYPEKK